MKKRILSMALAVVLAVSNIPMVQASTATVVTTETQLKNAITSGVSNIEFGAHITLTSLAGITISNQTLTIDLKGYSLNGKAGTDGTDGADSSSGDGRDGTDGTDGGNVFTLSNANLTIKNGYVLAGEGGDGGDGGDGGSSSSCDPGDGADAADGGDCITITSKSTLTLDTVTLSGGNGGTAGYGGTVMYYNTLIGMSLWKNGTYGHPGAGGTAIQGPVNLTVTNSTVQAGKANNSANGGYYGYGTLANTSGFAIYAASGSDIAISGSTITGYYTTTIWAESASLSIYDSKVTSASESIMYGANKTMPAGYTTDHSGEAIKMVGTSNTLLLDDVSVKNGRYDNNYVDSASGIYIENATAAFNDVTIYGVKHALEASKSTVEITDGNLYVDLDYKVIYYGLESNYPCDALGSTNSTITIHSGTLKGDSYTVSGTTYTSCVGSFTVGPDSEITSRVYANSSSAGSCVVELTDIPPVIASQPQAVSVVAGATATFTVGVTEGSSPVSYQWYYNTTGYNNGTGTAAGTSASLSVNTTSAMDGRYYHCKIIAGSTTLYTNAVKLTVEYAPTSATISRNPSTAVTAGDTITFTASVTGPGNPTTYSYQWYVGGSAVYGATGSTYTRTVLATDSGKAVYCEVSNSVGSVVTSSVTMSVYYPPTAVTISKSPTTAVTAWSDITFTASVTGAGNPTDYTYQWYVDGGAVTGATNATYTRTAISSDNGKAVYCTVSNGAGSIHTSSLTMTVYYSHTVSTPASVTVNAGGNATFQVTASGGYPSSYTYQWYVGGMAVSGATSSSFTMTANATDNGKSVHCIVSNGQFTVTSGSALLTVQYTPTVSCYASATAVSHGETIAFYTFITSHGNPSTYTYQWFVGGVAIDGATSSQYSYTANQSDDGKAVYCILSSEAGTVMATPQVITVYPTVESASLIASITDVSGAILGPALYMDSSQIVYPYSSDGFTVSFDTIPVTGQYVTAYAELLGQTYPVFFTNEQETNVTHTKYPSQGQAYIDPSTLPTTVRSTPLTIYVTMYSDETLTQAVESDGFTMYIGVDTSSPVVSFQSNGYTQECTISVRDVMTGVGTIAYTVNASDGSLRTSGTSATADFTLALEAGDTVTVTATDKVGNQGSTTSSGFVVGTGGSSLPESLLPTVDGSAVYHYKTTLFDCFLIGGNYNNVS